MQQEDLSAIYQLVTWLPLYITQPIADTHFNVPQKVEGWVDKGTAVRVHSPCPRLYIAAAVAINTTVRGVI